MAAQDFEFVDDFGRTTRFCGVELATASTGDLSADGDVKPKWTEITVWRTQGGKYIVAKQTHYRLAHTDPQCPRLLRDKAVVVEADDLDTVHCRECNRAGVRGTLGQQSKAVLDVMDSAQQLPDYLGTFSPTGARHHSPFARSLLAQLSEADPAIAAVWMVQTVV